jgi:hypothetical protein
MPLQRGEVQGYDFNRMTVEFTMLNQGSCGTMSSPIVERRTVYRTG